MALHFTVLASGSGGNASFVAAGGPGLLLDVGLGPRQIAGRLEAVGLCWERVRAVVLSHTHGDHWHERTLAHVHRRGLPVYCHPEHAASLRAESPAFADLAAAGLVRGYEVGGEFQPAAGLRLRPFKVRHDGGVTCGFRVECGDDGGPGCSLAYATDLGSWHEELARLLADADVLALEFNHDVALERSSGRSPRLIARVLGDHGHLSNAQAAALLRRTLQMSRPGRLRHLVQMHLSRDCNRAALAVAAVREALGGLPHGLHVHTACQHEPGPSLVVHPSPAVPVRTAAFEQRLLPGWDD